jgi:hypothetical protein
MTPSLTGQAVARADLDGTTVAAMRSLFAQHYQRVTADSFQADLAQKDWVVLLRDQAGTLQGFTSFALYRSCAAGYPVSVVYSGDTVVHPSCWGTAELPRMWIHSVLEQSAGMGTPLWWLLISSGYKTYRFLSVFFREFQPNYSQPSPAATRALKDALAAERFGRAYDAEAGVVRLGARATPLRAGIADVTPRRLQDPHVAYFAARNPGHAAGDELVCLARVHPDNFTAAGRRMAR